MRTRMQCWAIASFSFLFAVAVAVAAVPASAIIIDNFEEGDFTVQDPPGGGATSGEQAGLSPANVLGGVRLVTVTATGGLPADMGVANLLTTPGDDGVALTVTGPNTTATYQFVYDGIAGGVNNASGGALGLNVTGIPSVDVTSTGAPAGVTTNLRLWDSGGFWTSPTIALGAGTTSISLVGITVNPADIRALRLTVLNVDLLDTLSVSQIEAVPEPASALLLAGGLAALARRRRRARA